MEGKKHSDSYVKSLKKSYVYRSFDAVISKMTIAHTYEKRKTTADRELKIIITQQQFNVTIIIIQEKITFVKIKNKNPPA